MAKVMASTIKNMILTISILSGISLVAAKPLNNDTLRDRLLTNNVQIQTVIETSSEAKDLVK
ncbi:MAG: hypothetical protein M0P49_03730 [Bacilli bacterium]|nr:hypothetical protein [Bacilli bacterium]